MIFFLLNRVYHEIKAGIPTKTSLSLLPIAAEKAASFDKPTKPPAITKANSWIPSPAGTKKTIALNIAVKDSMINTSIILTSIPIIKKNTYISKAPPIQPSILIKSAKKTNPKIKILLVTILTSISNSSIKKIGHTKTIKELVKKQTRLALESGCNGIVCAGSDLKFVKKIFKGEIITPGIRLRGDKTADQKRIMGPREAFKNGSTALVMGRSIIKGNIKNNISRLIKELK